MVQKTTTLAGASRATARSVAVIRGWIEESRTHWQDHTEGEARADGRYFRPHEVVQVAKRVRLDWQIDLDALERVHRARGGYLWFPQVAVALWNTPPAIIEELEQLREENARLKRLSQASQAETPVSTRPAPVRPAPVHIAIPNESPEYTMPLYSDLPLMPAAWVTMEAHMKLHGMKKYRSSQWRKAYEHGHLSGLHHSDAGWRHNGRKVHWAIDTEGRTSFGRTFGHLEWYQFCTHPTCESCQAARDRRGLTDSTTTVTQAISYDAED